MSKQKTSGGALRQVTLKAMVRRRGASLLLAAVAALGVFASAALQNLTARQEAAIADMVRNTEISCVVTDAQGLSSDNLYMFSAFVDMLTGRRREVGCYLDDYVNHVRAKASTPLEQPRDATLRRILSFDSDSALSAVEGARIELEEGWTEDVFRTEEKVCIVSSGMATETGEDGLPYVTVLREETPPVRLQVIGTVSGGPGNTIWCPFYVRMQEGIYEAVLVESCSFDIADNARLEECKAGIYEVFVQPKLSGVNDGLTFGVLIQDETYLSTLEELESNLSTLQLLLPILTVLWGGIGFLAAYLATRGRMREFAVMRCLGLKKRRIFGQVFGEQALLALFGAVVGGAAGLLLEGTLTGRAMASAGGILAIFLAGAAIANINVTRVNVMKLMKAEE